MPIPVSTTKITIARVMAAANADGYDPNPPAPTTVASGVRAVIDPPSANNKLSGGNRIVYTAKMTTDPCDIQPDDQVTDSAGTEWRVMWVHPFSAFGISMMTGQVRLVTGAT